MIFYFTLAIKDHPFLLYQSLKENQYYLIHNQTKFILFILNQNNEYHQNQHIHSNFHTYLIFCDFNVLWRLKNILNFYFLCFQFHKTHINHFDNHETLIFHELINIVYPSKD
jgi:hypothetical protein